MVPADDEAVAWAGRPTASAIFEVRRPGQLAVRFLIAFPGSLQLHDRIDFSHRLSVFDVREAT